MNTMQKNQKQLRQDKQRSVNLKGVIDPFKDGIFQSEFQERESERQRQQIDFSLNRKMLYIFEILSILFDIGVLVYTIKGMPSDDKWTEYFKNQENYFAKLAFLNDEQSLRQANCHRFSQTPLNQVGMDKYAEGKAQVFEALFMFCLETLGFIISFKSTYISKKVFLLAISSQMLFMIIYPDKLCVNFKDECIVYSPILDIYPPDFVLFNKLVLLGLITFCIAIFAFIVSALMEKYKIGSKIMSQMILLVGFTPYIVIGFVNFMCSMWTNSRELNIFIAFSLSAGMTAYKLSDKTQYLDDYEENEKSIISKIQNQFSKKLKKQRK